MDIKEQTKFIEGKLNQISKLAGETNEFLEKHGNCQRIAIKILNITEIEETMKKIEASKNAEMRKLHN